MAKKNESAAGPAAPTIATVVAATDPRDAEIERLKKELSAAEAEHDRLNKLLLKASEEQKHAAPSGDFVSLRGKIYQIERTVEARFATDEARKGYIDLDAELVVLKR